MMEMADAFFWLGWVFLCETRRILCALCGLKFINAEGAENTQSFAEGCTDFKYS